MCSHTAKFDSCNEVIICLFDVAAFLPEVSDVGDFLRRYHLADWSIGFGTKR